MKKQTTNTTAPLPAVFTSFPKSTEWVKGTCGAYFFEAKLLDTPSDKGISGGRVTRLLIVDEMGGVEVSYNYAFDVLVKSWNKPVFDAIMALLEGAPKRLTTEIAPAATEADYYTWLNQQREKVAQFVSAGESGKLEDELNPAYLFSTTASDILAKIVKGEISATFLASRELANRGLDKNGKWVGFPEANRIHFCK